MALQFGHERLAEFHHFVVGLAFRVEVRTSFAAPHGQRGKAVFEHLFEREELQDAEVYRSMEAQSALVGTDRAVHLYAVTAVDLDLALVVEPRHAEHYHALGFGDPFENFHLGENRIFQDVRGQ